MKKIYFIVTPLIVLFFIDIILWGFIKYVNYLDNWENRDNIWKFDSITGWYNVSNADIEIKAFEFHTHYSSDEKGFRKNNINSKNDSIILFLGDSFTQGLEVNDGETFSYLLQKNSKYKIINAGVRGFGIDQEYLLLERLVNDSMKIKTVYVCFYINDLKEIIHDNIYSKWMNKPRFIINNDSLELENFPVEKKKTNSALIKKEKKFIKQDYGLKYKISNIIKTMFYKSSIYNVLIKNIQYSKFGLWLYRKNLMNIPDYMSYDWKIVSNDIIEYSLPILDKLLNRFNSLAYENNFDIIFVIIPSEFQYQKKMILQINSLKKLYDFEFPINETYDSIITLMKIKNIKYLYPLTEFKKSDVIKPLTFKLDKHFNKNGHIIMKNIIEDFDNENFNNR